MRSADPAFPDRSPADRSPAHRSPADRSTDSGDYQDLPQAVAVMAKTHAAGTSTGWHHHPRGQLLYGIKGLMVASTGRGTWAVPTGHALVIPPTLEHSVSMHGDVLMHTAYLEAGAAAAALSDLRVILVSPLLDAVLAALSQEPVVYDPRGRGPHLAALLLHEVATAPDAPFALPFPTDPRLLRLCQALVDTPALDLDLDRWADQVAVSRRTLTRRFRAETGLSFGQWRRQLRLLHVLKRRAEGASVKEGAADVGYRSPQSLAAMMRRSAGR